MCFTVAYLLRDRGTLSPSGIHCRGSVTVRYGLRTDHWHSRERSELDSLSELRSDKPSFAGAHEDTESERSEDSAFFTHVFRGVVPAASARPSEARPRMRAGNAVTRERSERGHSTMEKMAALNIRRAKRAVSPSERSSDEPAVVRGAHSRRHRTRATEGSESSGFFPKFLAEGCPQGVRGRAKRGLEGERGTQ